MLTKKKIIKLDIVRFYNKFYKNRLDEKLFRLVLNDINTEIRKKVYEGHIVHLPRGLGELYVRRSNRHKLVFTEEGNVDFIKTTVMTDWGSTNKLWKEQPELKGKTYLLYENIHTGGYKMKLIWRTPASKHDHVRYMQFKPARVFKRGLAKYIKDNNKIDYFDK